MTSGKIKTNEVNLIESACLASDRIENTQELINETIKKIRFTMNDQIKIGIRGIKDDIIGELRKRKLKALE